CFPERAAMTKSAKKLEKNEGVAATLLAQLTLPLAEIVRCDLRELVIGADRCAEHDDHGHSMSRGSVAALHAAELDLDALEGSLHAIRQLTAPSIEQSVRDLVRRLHHHTTGIGMLVRNAELGSPDPSSPCSLPPQQRVISSLP
ncbi:MAG: hypothetical protein SFX73_03575, partial [Kofleriaceae bacterium]|nr:hypothetical protein [Kofleriaceae bacterium]